MKRYDKNEERFYIETTIHHRFSLDFMQSIELFACRFYIYSIIQTMKKKQAKSFEDNEKLNDRCHK